MRWYSIILICEILFQLVKPFKRSDILVPKVYKGSIASNDKFPYLVRLVHRNPSSDDEYLAGCRSPIISETWILTHQSCDMVRTYPKFAHVYDDLEERLPVNKTDLVSITNTEYWWNSYLSHHLKSELILMKAEGSLIRRISKPAAIMKQVPNTDTQVIITGHNSSNYYYSNNSIHHFSVPIIDARFCKEKIKDACRTDYTIKPSDFCTDEPHGQDSRNDYVDRGSAVQIREGVIVGIVKVTGDEDFHGCPGVHVAIGLYADFINKHVKDVEWIS